jgi:light-regulated signal transduction histidine kinase (bacteriophytochrome)
LETELLATKESLALLNIELSPYGRIYSLFPSWAKTMRCDGVLLVVDGKKYGHGLVGETVDRIVQWVSSQDNTIASYCTGEIYFHFSSLFFYCKVYFFASSKGSSFSLDRVGDLGLDFMDDGCCGFLFVQLQDTTDSGIYFFRNERVKNILWAGEPKKVSDKEGNLNPRSSFLQYQEVTRCRSKKWTNQLLEHAVQIQRAVTRYLLRWKSEKHRVDAERKKEEIERIQRENEVARQSIITRNNFLTTVSHELRTPIHSILGNTEKLIEIQPTDPDSQQACAMIRK